MPAANGRIQSFDLKPGRLLGGKYVVERFLGRGWEGEVYKVVEKRTGVSRAAKLFFPHRNEGDRAVTFYAQKLDRLRRCPIVIQYIHSESFRHRGQPISSLISEYVEGELLSDFVKRQPGRRLQPFEAMHMLHTLVNGIEQIHAAREYHGDLHDDNVLIQRQGILYSAKLVDFYHWGRATRAHLQEDVFDLVRILYDAVGGPRRYASQPQVIKDICRGLRRDLIASRFSSARHLREHLETFQWPR